MRYVYVLEEISDYDSSSLIGIFGKEGSALKAAEDFMKDESYSKEQNEHFLHSWYSSFTHVQITKQEVK